MVTLFSEMEVNWFYNEAVTRDVISKQNMTGDLIREK